MFASLFILAGQHVEPLYRIDSNSVSATIIVSSRLAWTCTYLMKFSSRRRNPPMDRSRKAQFTKPVKFSNPDVHDRSESRGLWMLKFKFGAGLVVVLPPVPLDHFDRNLQQRNVIISVSVLHGGCSTVFYISLSYHMWLVGKKTAESGFC
jgi:hypothetical protein